MPLDKGLDTKSLRTILSKGIQGLVTSVITDWRSIPECFGVQRSRVLDVSC